MPRLQPVPDRPPRAVAYVRVSDEGGRGEDLMSPAIQLTAIKDHCARRGYELVLVLEDIDLTGRFWKRRKVEQAIALVESRDADVVVVWKVSRVCRNRKDWAIAVDRVEVAGGQLESATEGYDAKTSSGRLTRGMLAEFAAFESELIGENWRSAHRQRTDRGLPHYGPPRLGYDYEHRAGYTRNDQAELVREMYARYVRGEGVGEITMWLRALDVVQPKTGRRWTRYGVQYFLDSGFAAGLIQMHAPDCGCRSKSACSNRIRRPGKHEAILTAEEWAAYQRARDSRRGTRVSAVSVSRLAGVVICGGCKRPMQLQGSSGKSRHAFVCRTNRLGAVECEAPAWVRRERAEQLVREWLPTVADEVDELAAGIEPRSVTQSRQDTLNRKLLDVDASLGRLAESNAVRPIPESAYALAYDNLMRDRVAIEKELRAAAPPDLSGMVDAAAGLLAVWDGEPAEVNPLARQLVRVLVRRGSGSEVIPGWLRAANGLP